MIEAMLTHAGTPAEVDVASAWRNTIFPARLIVGNEVLLGSDASPGRQVESKGFSVSLQITEPADAERIFHALAENATVLWDARLGVVVDRFGIPWTINCSEAVQPSFQRTLQAGIPELEFRDSSIRVLSSGI